MKHGNDSIERDVKTFLEENFILDGDANALDPEESLTELGVLDSMGVLEVIMFIEQTYGIEIPDEDTLPENLDSVSRIVSYIRGRLAEAALT